MRGSNLTLAKCFWVAILGWALAQPAASLAAFSSRKMPIVPKWNRFEHAWKSSLVYSNPVQAVTLNVTFTSPGGESYEIYGFWDGDKTWRARFAPDQPGRWTYKTTCSDQSNRGLHNQSGEFLCTAADNKTRFTQHGPVELATGHTYFRHSDGTPFFWLADDVSNGARLSRLRDWGHYAKTRAAQKFTVAQWIATPGIDPKKQPGYTGKERVIIQPEYFRRLDEKLAVLTQAGLLSAIVPVDLAAAGAEGLADDQFALLIRYMMARWGADPVAWVIPLDPVNQPQTVARWRQIGNALFGQTSRPIIVVADRSALLDQLRDQVWVDAFSYQPLMEFTEDALRRSFEILELQAKNAPTRPSIARLPPENALLPGSDRRLTADDVRRACYWSFLLNAPAGISYATPAIRDWTTASSGGAAKVDELAAWEKSLFLPSVRQLSAFGRFVESIDFRGLRPKPGIILNQPGLQSPSRLIAGATSDAGDLSLVYVPDERTVDLTLEGMPPSPSVSWLNPRTGETSPAVAVVGENSCQFPTPEPGDWLLVLKAGQ